MEYNEEQEKEYISRESLNRLCKEAQELRWYKRYRSGASKACFLLYRRMLCRHTDAEALGNSKCVFRACAFGIWRCNIKRPLVWRWFLSSFLFCLHVFQQR